MEKRCQELTIKKRRYSITHYLHPRKTGTAGRFNLKIYARLTLDSLAIGMLDILHFRHQIGIQSFLNDLMLEGYDFDY